MSDIPSEYRGWWRITETSQWVDDGLDILGPALLSLTGYDDRLRGTFRIKNGDSSRFIAVRAEEPDEPIPPPPSYRDKWSRRW